MTQIRLSEFDRSRVRHHLGYLNVEPVISIALGFPSAQQAEFLVETAMDNLFPSWVPRILSTLDTLDCIEGQMVGALSRLRAQQLGELKLRNDNNEPSEQDLLEREYMRWSQRLANDLGCPINVYAYRYQQGGAINVPVAPV